MKNKLNKILVFIVLVAMMSSSALAVLPTQGNQTTPSIYSHQRKVQPFVLDNFKIIEATLNHLGVTNEELTAFIKQGKKLEDVLKIKKISIKKFKKEVIKEYYKAVDEGLLQKQINEEQASQLKNAIKETIKGWLPKK